MKRMLQMALAIFLCFGTAANALAGQITITDDLGREVSPQCADQTSGGVQQVQRRILPRSGRNSSLGGHWAGHPDAAQLLAGP